MMAQTTIKLGFKWKWWAWPLFYVMAWCAYPVLAFCTEATVDRFAVWLSGFIARHGLKATVVDDASYVVALD